MIKCIKYINKHQLLSARVSEISQLRTNEWNPWINIMWKKSVFTVSRIDVDVMQVWRNRERGRRKIEENTDCAVVHIDYHRNIWQPKQIQPKLSDFVDFDAVHTRFMRKTNCNNCHRVYCTVNTRVRAAQTGPHFTLRFIYQQSIDNFLWFLYLAMLAICVYINFNRLEPIDRIEDCVCLHCL